MKKNLVGPPPRLSSTLRSRCFEARLLKGFTLRSLAGEVASRTKRSFSYESVRLVEKGLLTPPSEYFQALGLPVPRQFVGVVIRRGRPCGSLTRKAGAR